MKYFPKNSPINIENGPFFSRLKAFSLEASISELGKGAFRGCASLEKLTFTPTITEIPDELCSGCTAVESITCMTATPPVCPANTFDGIPTDISVTVPMANVGDYRNETGWNRFSNIIGKY